MRRFNTSGPNIIADHYTLPRLDLIEKGKTLVHDSRYFTIWAPRQTGKSTYFELLTTELEKEGYKVAQINFENYKTSSISSFVRTLTDELGQFWHKEFISDDLQSIFQDIANIKNEKLVLIIDEVEGINPEFFGEFLHSIRNVYHRRTRHSLKSVILVGVSNIVGVVQDNASPFNIVDNLNVPYFTNEETLELLGQHEQETGQLFDPSVKRKVSDITANQPGLVNGFAEMMVSNNRQKAVLDFSDYMTVEKTYLNRGLNKNIANIINKGMKHRRFLERLLFTEEKVPFQIYQENIKELYVNGIITYDEDDNVTFKVPLYRKCLHAAFYPYLNGETKRIEKNIKSSEYLDASGILDLDKVIEEYKIYAERRGFQYFREKDENDVFISIQEAGLVYSFETFVNAFLAVLKGKSYLEAHTALGRTDLLINVGGHEQVVEAKVFKNISQFNDGKAQLAYYAQHLGLRIAYYLVFADTEISHSELLDADEMIEGTQIKTHVVRYELDKDFTQLRKKKAAQTKAATKKIIKPTTK
ncbi:MAG: ATP-binding protein [Saprospiraceae bacterium]|nr:ATP-binding protein [Saprospiraceae bacterium]